VIAAIVFLLGLALVTAGAALIFLPAAFLLAGTLLMAGAWFYTRAGQATG
jgi:hypothetical protein